MKRMHLHKCLLVALYVVLNCLFAAYAQGQREVDIDKESQKVWGAFTDYANQLKNAKPGERGALRGKLEALVENGNSNSFTPSGCNNNPVSLKKWMDQLTYQVKIPAEIVRKEGPFVRDDGLEGIHAICYNLKFSHPDEKPSTCAYRVDFKIDQYGNLKIVAITRGGCRPFEKKPGYSRGGVITTLDTTIPIPDSTTTEPKDPTRDVPKPGGTPGPAGQVPCDCSKQERTIRSLKDSLNRVQVRLQESKQELAAARDTIVLYEMLIQQQRDSLDMLIEVVKDLRYQLDSAFCLNEFKNTCEDIAARNNAIEQFNSIEQLLITRPMDDKRKEIREIFKVFNFSTCHTCLRPEDYCIMGKILLYHSKVIEDLLPGDSDRAKRDFKDAKIFEILSKGALLGPSYADVQCLQRLAEDFNVVLEDRTNDNLDGVMQAIIKAIDEGRYTEALYKYSVYRYILYYKEGRKATRADVSVELEMNIAKVLLWDLGNISANQGAFKKGTWIHTILSSDSMRINTAKNMLTDLIKDKTVSDKIREQSFILLQKYRN